MSRCRSSLPLPLLFAVPRGRLPLAGLWLCGYTGYTAHPCDEREDLMRRLSAQLGFASVALMLLTGCPEGIEPVTPESLGGKGSVGASCRPIDDADGQCDTAIGGNYLINAVCMNDTCLIDCSNGGTGMCQAAQPFLACSPTAGDVCVKACVDGACDEGFSCLSSEGVCLPTGGFPSSPCRVFDDPAGRCDQDVAGVEAADMVCAATGGAGTCVIDCADGGTSLCQKVNAVLTCSTTAGNICLPGCGDGACQDGLSCFAKEEACLPTGAFPGSPCRVLEPACDSALGGVTGADMVCVAGTDGDVCLLDCATGGEALCQAVDPSLHCSAAAGDRCLPGCAEGDCDDGFSCLVSEGTCLPTGSFPGSDCRAGDDPCDQNVGGVAAADMACVQGRCLIGCAGDDDDLCSAVNPLLTCAAAAGDICLPTCDAEAGAEQACDEGFSCFATENACLPTGGFPGSVCRPAQDPTGRCDANLGGNEDADMRCVNDLCLVDCAAGGPALCDAIDTSLSCSAAAGDVCVPKCGPDGECDDGLACFSSENVCLPQGSFPGSPCQDTCAQNLLGVEQIDMVCTNNTCVVDCSFGGDVLCQVVDPSLACSAAGGNICVPSCNPSAGEGNCPTGLACFAGESVCLPVGAFPGGPCTYPAGSSTGACGSLGPLPMVCADPGLGSEVCLVDCTQGGHAACQQVDSGLSCLPATASGLDNDVCVPNGTFPESLCREQAFNRCDLGLLGQSDLNTQCYAGTCQLDCTNSGDTICALYAGGLGLPSNAFSCTDTGESGSFCARAGCAVGQPCPADYHCDASGAGGAGVCLPYLPVHVVHTNDLHSHAAGTAPMSNPTQGGYPQLAGAIQAAQADANARGAVLMTLDGGDFMMGSLFHVLGGLVEFDFFRYLGYDAVAVGNHELDWGPAGLAAFLSNNGSTSPILDPICAGFGDCPTLSAVPVLSANIAFDDIAPEDDGLEALFDEGGSESTESHPLKRFVVLTKANGTKVGVFGLIGAQAVEITPTAAPLQFSSLVETAQNMVGLLRLPPHNCDIVMAVSHSGSSPPPYSNEDEVVAEQVVGLDVIVSGHTHEEVPPKVINGTVVMQAGEYGKLMGALELGLVTRNYGPDAGKIASDIRRYTATSITAAMPSDAVMAAAQTQYITQINAVLAPTTLAYDTPLGAITEDFVKVDGGESNLGNLIADANRVWVNSSGLLQTTGEAGPIDIAVEANGVIRDNFLVDPANVPTPLWVADVFNAEPLGASPTETGAPPAGVGYPMVDFWITADEVKAVMEVAATLYYLRGAEFWLNVSGMKWRYDVTRAGFDRVTGIWLDADGTASTCDSDANLLDGSGNAKDPDQLYRVAANLYVASFASQLDQFSQGALTVVPKAANGDILAPAGTIAALAGRILPDGAGGELRQWQTLVQHVVTQAAGAILPQPTPTGRVAESSSSPCP